MEVTEDTAKQWIIKQALWQTHLQAPRYMIPRSKFDISTPNAVHKANFLFMPDDKLPCNQKVYKYTLTVVDFASRYKEA